MPRVRRAYRTKITPEAVGRQHVLELLVSEWAVRILRVLDRSPRLYSEMRRELHSASKATLAQTLRKLQSAGLVWRKAYPTSPVRVEYSLTSLGKSFIEPLNSLCEWAEQHERELSAVSGRGSEHSKIRAKKRRNFAGSKLSES